MKSSDEILVERFKALLPELRREKSKDIQIANLTIIRNDADSVIVYNKQNHPRWINALIQHDVIKLRNEYPHFVCIGHPIILFSIKKAFLPNVKYKHFLSAFCDNRYKIFDEKYIDYLRKNRKVLEVNNYNDAKLNELKTAIKTALTNTPEDYKYLLQNPRMS